jgi:uncharacterized protein YaiI (UPF0178 family)
VKIWVDADATPVVIKDILFRASERTGIPITLVANQRMRIPESPLIDFILVEAGFDVADNEIVKRLSSGDLVITADIPLAADVLEKGGHALDPRGEMFSPDTIRSRLNMRDFMETLRSGGMVSGGPPAMSQSDRKAFAGALDKFLTRNFPATDIQTYQAGTGE